MVNNTWENSESEDTDNREWKESLDVGINICRR